MGKVIKFKKPQLEDSFMESLTEEQQEMFIQILMQFEDCYRQLEAKYVKKIAECEMLRLENDFYKKEMMKSE